jgi:hypothetical protein
MTPGQGAPESHLNADDLRKLCDKLQQNIAIRKHMVASDVAEFLDEISRSFQENPTQDPTGDSTLSLQNIQLAKENAMVS